MKTFISKSRILVLTFFAMPFLSLAQDGSLDLSFGTGGIVTTAFGVGSNDKAYAVAVQSDGKIVAVGRKTISPMFDIGIVRYNIDGSLDKSFGTDGLVTTDFEPTEDYATAVAIQADGKIVIVGINNGSTYKVIMARYNIDGSLDNSFDSDGLLIPTITELSRAFTYAVKIQTDGKIIVAGHGDDATTGQRRGFILRLNPDGSYDNSFDGDGIVISSEIFSEVRDIAIQSDGKILLGGKGYGLALARFNTDGSLDNSFGSAGSVSTEIGTGIGINELKSIALQADGKIVAVGDTVSKSDSHHLVLLRYNADGSLDNSFDGDGIVVPVVGGIYSFGTSVKIQADGKILVGGMIAPSLLLDFGLWRFNIDGSLDKSFDSDGLVTTAVGKYGDEAYSMAIQADGKIILAGESATVFGGKRNFAVARYNNPSLSISLLTGVNKEISIYPNPTQDILHIQGAALGSSIALYDMQGRVLKREELQSSTPQIDMRQLPLGNYLLRIISPAGEVGSAKVLKE